ncbi:phage minor structural protein, N-terminal region [Marininema mesophilum]|uniref:Phage minor structural protein, N-terminal region n=1 Tax=Marininema mesophilum TaxID=1048340 RepID=A0A1H3BU36_9BACL|nr:phage tail spike protein [Marininema mesophilum]SDX44874.1 phage minor structural protein, N-terminal region [Marininema mesophilum]
MALSEKDRGALLILLNRNEERVATIGHKGSPVYEPIFRDAENESATLTFRVRPVDEEGKYLTQRNYVLLEDPWNPGGWRLLEIMETDEVSDSSGRPMKEIQCEESALRELSGDWVDDIRLWDTTPNDALTRLLSSAKSRWKVGSVSHTGIASTNVYHTSASEGLSELMKTWGGVIRFRVTVSGSLITGRYIDWVSTLEDYTGVRWMKGMNLKSLKKTVISREVATAIYPYGKGGDNSTTDDDETGARKLTIADVEWSKAKGDPADKPKGQTWVGDEAARSIWGYPGSSGRRHIFMTQTFDDTEDPKVLIQQGWDALKPLTQEWASYEVEITDLSREVGREHEATQLGTAGLVVDDSFNPPIEVRARVVAAEVDLNNRRNLQLTLGSFVPTPFDSISDIREELGNKVTKGAPVTQLRQNIEQMADRLRSGVGYKDFSPTLGDIWTSGPYGDPETTHYMQAKSGILAFANRWDPVAGEPDWQVGLSGDGINADAITAGTLNAERVNIETVSEAGSSLVRLKDGYLCTYENDYQTLKIGKYGIRFFDNGWGLEDPNNDWLGTIGYSFDSDASDDLGVYRYRGVGISTVKDLHLFCKIDSSNKVKKQGLKLQYALDYARLGLSTVYFGDPSLFRDMGPSIDVTPNSSDPYGAVRLKVSDGCYLYLGGGGKDTGNRMHVRMYTTAGYQTVFELEAYGKGANLHIRDPDSGSLKKVQTA